MNEGDLEPEHAAARLRVDQLGTELGEIVDCRPDVVDPIGDVVHPRAAAREEPAYGRVAAERRQKLDTAVPDPDRCSLDALVLDPCAMLEPAAEQPLVGADRLVEVGDGDSDVVDPSYLHAGDATGRGLARRSVGYGPP